MKIMIKRKLQKGSVMLMTTLLVALVGTATIINTARNVSNEAKDSKDLFQTKQSLATAESSFEDVLYRLKSGKQVDNSESLTISNSTATTVINNINSTLKEVLSSGIFSSNQREISTRLTTTTGLSFSYGMQTGQGGIVMGSNSGIIGNIYANGEIIGNNGAYVTGTAIAANGNAALLDQTFGTGTPSTDVIFGTTNAVQDVAQSFTLNANNPLAKIQIYIKKVGNPSNPTVTIRSNNSGNPGGTVLATGTLNSSFVTTSYGWIDVTFNSYPQLSANTTYWLTIDVSSNNASNYFVIGGDTGYANGTGKTGRVGSSWSQIGTNTDLYFGIFTGGTLGSIQNVNIGTSGAGVAQANTITNSSVTGALYCQTGSFNNKACDSSLPDPTPQPFPVSASNIAEWKNVATAGGITNGNVTITGTQTLGSQKIIGNLTINNGAILTLNGTVWVTGNINLEVNSLVNIPSSYGSNGAVIIADGEIRLRNNASFQGSGTSGGYIMAITTSTSATAISVENNGGSVILYAPNGTAVLSNNAGANQITAYKIILGNNATITYDSGLINQNFTSGPSGTWKIGSWSELK